VLFRRDVDAALMIGLGRIVAGGARPTVDGKHGGGESPDHGLEHVENADRVPASARQPSSDVIAACSSSSSVNSWMARSSRMCATFVVPVSGTTPCCVT
jgi:hypothetical protein